MSATALPAISWARPPGRGLAKASLLLFVWLLPFHSVFIAALVGSRSVPFDTIRFIAAWKEVALVFAVLWVMARAAGGRGPGVQVNATDMLVAALIGLGGLFLLLENPLLRAGIPVGAELYGFRDTVFFMFLYFVGRGAPELAEDGGIPRHLFLMGLVVSLIGVVERIFVTPEMLVLLGVASYVNEFLGMSAFTAGSEYGLPQNYWSILGGTAVQRAGSVFLHSQGFALPFLLLIPAATVWALGQRRRYPLLARVGYALLWAGLLVTITRMTIVVCLVQVGLYFLMVRRPEWAVGTLFAALAAVGVALALIPGLAVFVWETLTWQTGSSASHLKDWTKGFIAFLSQPWGHGLGTSEQVAIRFGLPPVSADNLFLAYGTQLGAAGLVGIVAVLLAIMGTAWKTFRNAASDSARRFGAVLALATLGVLLNGSTSSIFSSNLLAYVYFLSAGVLVTIWERDRHVRRTAEF